MIDARPDRGGPRALRRVEEPHRALRAGHPRQHPLELTGPASIDSHAVAAAVSEGPPRSIREFVREVLAPALG